jgi:hypothetical protein
MFGKESPLYAIIHIFSTLTVRATSKYWKSPAIRTELSEETYCSLKLTSFIREACENVRPESKKGINIRTSINHIFSDIALASIPSRKCIIRLDII